MAGFTNVSDGQQVMYADNVDFTGGVTPVARMTTNGQLLIGSDTSPRIKVGNITSSSLTVSYSSPNITIETKGGTQPVEKFTLQAGVTTVVPTALGVVIFNGSSVAQGTNPVRTNGTGANTMQLEVQTSQAIAATDATKIGLCNFNSAHFSVDTNGFVSIITAGFTWSEVSGAFTSTKQNGYFVTNTASSTLPAAPTEGDTIKYILDTANALTLTANAGQTIRISGTVSAAAGTAVSTAQGDTLVLVYKSTGTVWIAESVIGNWILT